ncbi:spore germination protein [Bacillus sp. CLL-7-23]|uniref:Spore germination protein n=1 Tax=Bacillus changyiensis TaxID=3004103 RepID=A0ABT4X740_9BACI|nr:spore germination protein [Bacillus changyiensis]MDA7028043.1 spore germination protein [Bacillus changyiensis]
MPAIVGPVLIRAVVDDSAASFGDVFAISPKSVDSSSRGSGAFNVGDFGIIQNGKNRTTLMDTGVIDQMKTFNL